MRFNTPIYRLKRDAKVRARKTGAPLHAELDAAARSEGFQSWSHLSATHALPARLLTSFASGELVLIGARPGHGKTALALEILAASNQPAGFFTLEYSEDVARSHLPKSGQIHLETSDAISGAYIARAMAAHGLRIAAIDYLQLLDQDRRKPPLEEQVKHLKQYAKDSGAIILLISQIDRRFDPSCKRPPSLAEIRLPNPLDLGHFSKACLLHEGRIEVSALA